MRFRVQLKQICKNYLNRSFLEFKKLSKAGCVDPLLFFCRFVSSCSLSVKNQLTPFSINNWVSAPMFNLFCLLSYNKLLLFTFSMYFSLLVFNLFCSCIGTFLLRIRRILNSIVISSTSPCASRYILNAYEYDDTMFQGPPRHLPRDEVFQLFGRSLIHILIIEIDQQSTLLLILR